MKYDVFDETAILSLSHQDVRELLKVIYIYRGEHTGTSEKLEEIFRLLNEADEYFCEEVSNGNTRNNF